MGVVVPVLVSPSDVDHSRDAVIIGLVEDHLLLDYLGGLRVRVTLERNRKHILSIDFAALAFAVGSMQTIHGALHRNIRRLRVGITGFRHRMNQLTY